MQRTKVLALIIIVLSALFVGLLWFTTSDDKQSARPTPPTTIEEVDATSNTLPDGTPIVEAPPENSPNTSRVIDPNEPLKLSRKPFKTVEVSVACADAVAPLREAARRDPANFSTATRQDPTLFDAQMKAQSVCSKTDWEQYMQWEYTSVYTDSLIALGSAQEVK